MNSNWPSNHCTTTKLRSRVNQDTEPWRRVRPVTPTFFRGGGGVGCGLGQAVWGELRHTASGSGSPAPLQTHAARNSLRPPTPNTHTHTHTFFSWNTWLALFRFQLSCNLLPTPNKQRRLFVSQKFLFLYHSFSLSVFSALHFLVTLIDDYLYTCCRCMQPKVNCSREHLCMESKPI